MPQPFFRSTARFRAEHAGLYAFVHGVTAALWNTRWHVGGYLAAVPDATREDLESRFVRGSGIHGVDVRRTFVEQSWDDHTEELARITLVNTAALYEAWLADIVQPFGSKKFAKELQFPSKGICGRTSRGVRDALADMTVSTSPAMESDVAVVLRKQRSYHVDKLDDLLLVYRYFKELRNSLVHQSGAATPTLVDAYTNIKGLTGADIGSKEFPVHHAPVIDAQTRLSLRGVIGFGGLVYSLVTTIDAVLAATTVAEQDFLQRFASVYDGSTLPVAQAERSRRVRGIVVKLGLPKLQSAPQLEKLLVANGLITSALRP